MNLDHHAVPKSGRETCAEETGASSPRPGLGQFQHQNSDSNGLLAIDQNKGLWIHPDIDEIKNNKEEKR